MQNYLRNMVRRILPIGMFLLIAFSGWTQSFQDGVRKGLVKVKFSPSVTSTLSKMPVNGRQKNVITGIASVDAVARASSATNMYRLFPFDEKNEAKLRKHGLHLWYVVEINENVDPKTVVSQFKQLQEVSVAEVEREKTAAPFTAELYTPQASTTNALPFNDPMLKDQWHYNNTGQTGHADADINLFEAWTKTTGANNIVVSVHDQGVDVNHKDLKANIWVNQAEANGTPGVDDDNNGYVDDVNGFNFSKNIGAVDPQFHATHVAGTIAAVNNNGIGVSGIAGGSGHGDGVKIMSLQIFGDAATERTYVYAANNGAVISQNSWGYTEPGSFEQSVLDAIDYFIAEAGNYPGSPMKGGIVIFAAGNSNYDADWYPGYHESILTVASIGPEWKKASYSNYGNWVEVSAPGGDQVTYGTKNGVLSTYPKDQYAYLQGTSMACPHVSGIAALALANSDHQLTNDELWNKLVTGVVDIEQYNADYIGKLGTGAIDAALAIQNDLGIKPQPIIDLAVTGIAQEFATLTWTVPADNDDVTPLAFELLYHTQPITENNLSAATGTVIKNEKEAGEKFTYELDGLLGLTTYYFAVVSADRWGNVSILSNVVSEKTNDGPSVAVDEDSKSIALEIDASASTSASHEITILNGASGILRWNHFMRHTNTSLSFNSSGLHYPVISNKSNSSEHKVATFNFGSSAKKLRSAEAATSSYSSIEKSYAYWYGETIGETDTTFTNSAAARFYVSETEGFNLTQVQMALKHNPAKGPVIVEVYKGNAPIKSNLLYAQEHNNYGTTAEMAYITLDEQLYFESGTTFWIALHVPSGNLYPLGIGYETDDTSSTNCFMSFDLGSTWAPLEVLLDSKDFAWSITAASYNQYLGDYLTLLPGSGDVEGNGEMKATLTADAANLINGSYNANLVLASNDAQQQELRIPVSVTVSGHKPTIKHIDIADYGSVFMSTSKTLELVLENVGFGNFNDPVFTFSNSAFAIDGDAPWQIGAREEVVIKVKFSPTTSGNVNGVLDFTNGDQAYQISLFGVGAETSKISISPQSQVVNNITIGDVVNAQVTVENTGAYPLKYFVPGFDSKDVSADWPTKFHSYGYALRSNRSDESNPISYEFQDIKSTGVDITSQLNNDAKYFNLDMGFDFPYYGKKMQTLYIAQKGFTVFDNTVRPINTPTLNNQYNPRGYISPLGATFSYIAEGQIFYQVEADRVIVQYDNVWDGFTPEHITAQMVLFANGDIRFYYDNMGFSEYNQQMLTILIEDLEQKDGIMLHNWEKQTELFNGLALGLDYPGPNIITKIENGSGIIAPGSSAQVDITIKTDSLAEGMINRYINFISNDPSSLQNNALVQLEVKFGGVPKPIVSTDTLTFGNVFQGAVKSSAFILKNKGTSNVDVASMNFVNNSFTLVGDQPATVKPGLYKNYDIQVPTAALATLEDWLSINYADGSQDTIYITANVVDAPGIRVDLSLLQQTMAYGDSISTPLTIENTGLGTLEVVATGKQWLSFDAPTTPSDITYTYQKENTGGVYQWIDIRKTGTQLPFADYQDVDSTYWRELKLPYPIEFYGKKYSSFKIGDAGIISFEKNPEAPFQPQRIPTPYFPGACIMPYWGFTGFNTGDFPKGDVGIFYQFNEDKIIITWSYTFDRWGGMGDPISAQVIFYKNGTMKFQYKVEEGGSDQTSHFATVGLQKDSSTGLLISEFLALDFGKGLAYVILPAKKFSVAPGSTLAGQINMDARNVFGGVYNEELKIQTNVPGSEYLVKPVELTVTGEANFVATETVDFGSKMILLESWGSPVTNYIDLDFANDGSAALDITWAQMADGLQNLNLMIQVDGMFGPEWTTVENIYPTGALETPTFRILPGDKLAVRAIFYPGEAGDFADELVITTNLGEKKIVLKGSGFEAPVLKVTTSSINAVMNSMNETTDKSINFNNLTGKSDLAYEVSIDYGRVTTTTSMSESMAKTVGVKPSGSFSISATKKISTARITSSYNRVLKYTQKDAADAHAGTGGGEPLVVATKYNAGPLGFNLSHIETWMRTETLEQGFIGVEIRAGGTTIANAATVAESKLEFTGTTDPNGDKVGSWYRVALNEPTAIYPNEDFYVIVTVPSGIERPVGIVNDEETVPGRYYYEEGGVWYNIQDIASFTNSGWLMFAAEETAGNSAWLNVTSDFKGSLGKGNSSSVNIHLDGANSTRGDQIASIVIKSNDPKHAVVKVPVKLHMNEAPRFIDAPESVSIAEKETTTFKIGILDKEGDAVTVQAAQSYPGVTHTFTGGLLSIVVNPDYGTSGNYSYSFTATDQYNASREVRIPVVVTHTNRAPVYVGIATPFQNYQKGIFKEYTISDFFKDDDGDKMTFTAVSADATIVSVFYSEGKFVIQPVKTGQTELTFVVKDVYGASITKALSVSVKPNEAPVVANALTDITTHTKEGATVVSIENVFTDADGDKLTYAISSANSKVTSASLTGMLLTITPAGVGETVVSLTATDPDGATAKEEIKVIVNTILGDVDNIVSIEFTVSPNPTKNRVKIFVPQIKTGHIRVMNYLGATVQVLPIITDHDTYYVDLDSEAAGVYLIEVNDGLVKTVKRIIKN